MPSSNPVWAVVVARVGHGAKSRLAAALSPAERRQLALAMLADVVAACVAADDLLAGTIAVVDEPAARWAAECAGALVVADPGLGDMNAAVSAGLQVARAHGATTALVVPGDIPLISHADVAALLAAAGPARRAVVVGASHDGQGTNALLLRPPEIIRPGFGPPSVGRHLQAGLAAGAVALVRADLDLALDIDTPADLAALHQTHPGRHTARALATLASRLATTER